MDLQELDEFFEANELNEIDEFIVILRTYNIKPRPDYINILSNKEFYQRFRLYKAVVVNTLLPAIGELLEARKPRWCNLDSLTQILIALRFYATGSFYITTGDFGGIHKSTAGRVINRVTTALLSLRPTYVRFPENDEERTRVVTNFFSISNFPNVIAAIDCTHIPIISPGGENAEIFRNRKGFFSLNVQACCDGNNKIMDIVARWPGSCHDSYIFSNSTIKNRFENGDFLDCVLLGDSGYPIKNYLMTPLPNPHTPAEVLYNDSQIRTRTIIERTFGILKRRFPVLSIPMRCKLPLIQRIIVATAILHNIGVENRDEIAVDNDMVVDDDLLANIDDNGNANHVNLVQQRYINYFQRLL